MFRLFCRFIFRWKGWKLDGKAIADIPKCVMIAAPHTSNWDAIFMLAAFDLMGIPVKFTIKKEWMVVPFRWFLAPLGALPIDRTPPAPGQPRKSMVEAMSHLFEGKDRLVVLVTPEGTRSLRKKWRTGFYFAAKMANVPVMLGYLDYAKKEAGIGGPVYISDDMNADMRQIMDFYRNITPKHPAKFSIDNAY